MDEGFEPKKLALLRVLQILKTETDEDHPITQEQICQKLWDDYGIVMRRQAVAYQLLLLERAGYDIVFDGRRGCYINDREFLDMELRVLIDAVLNSRYISEKDSRDLVKRISGLSSRFFRPADSHIRTTHTRHKTGSREVYRNIELIDEAIEKGLQIRYRYSVYTYSEQHTEAVPESRVREAVSPREMILYNHRYYLRAYAHLPQKTVMIYDKLDHISDLKILKTPAVEPAKNFHEEDYPSVEYQTFHTFLDGMMFGNSRRVELLIDHRLVDELIDWFGKDCILSRMDHTNWIKASFQAHWMAVKQWALLHMNEVEILSPEYLRKSFVRKLKIQLDKYQQE